MHLVVSTLVPSSTGGVWRSMIVTRAEGWRRAIASAVDSPKIPAPTIMIDSGNGSGIVMNGPLVRGSIVMKSRWESYVNSYFLMDIADANVLINGNFLESHVGKCRFVRLGPARRCEGEVWRLAMMYCRDGVNLSPLPASANNSSSRFLRNPSSHRGPITDS